MLQLDAVQLYDLSEAGRLLYRDPARLAREARRQHIPSARVEQEIGLPAPWVDAERGAGPADPEALRVYWLGRLAPPSPDARRPSRARDRLPAESLLEPEEAARRVFATPAALLRMDTEGTLPSLRVDGRVLYDEQLTDLVADDHADAAARRAEVLAWARFEYETQVEAPVAPPPAFEPVRQPTSTEPGHAAPEAAVTEPTDAPAAYEIPADLLGDEPPSRLIDVDGFETIDED